MQNSVNEFFGKEDLLILFCINNKLSLHTPVAEQDALTVANCNAKSLPQYLVVIDLGPNWLSELRKLGPRPG